MAGAGQHGAVVDAEEHWVIFAQNKSNSSSSSAKTYSPGRWVRGSPKRLVCGAWLGPCRAVWHTEPTGYRSRSRANLVGDRIDLTRQLDHAAICSAVYRSARKTPLVCSF
jgi:hypothetical protein